MMSKSLETIQQMASVQEAAKKMKEKDVSSFVVVDNQNKISPIQLGIAEEGYHIVNITRTSFPSYGKYVLTLKKDILSAIGNQTLDEGNSIRIIALEPNIPILACISCSGTVQRIIEGYYHDHDDDVAGNSTIVIDIDTGDPIHLQGSQ